MARTCERTYEYQGEIITCNREVYDGHFCILHSGEPKKSPIRFNPELTEVLTDGTGPIVLAAIYFVDCNEVFEGKTFERLVVIVGCTFGQPLTIRKAKFNHGLVLSSKTKVHSHLRFEECQFRDCLDFNDTIVDAYDVRFERCHLSATINIENSNFGGKLRIVSATRLSGLRITNSGLEGVALESCEFEQDVLLTEASLAQDFSCADVTFLKKLRVQMLSQTTTVDFRKVSFKGEARFDSGHMSKWSPSFEDCDMTGVLISTLPLWKLSEGLDMFHSCRWPVKKMPLCSTRTVVEDEKHIPNDLRLVSIYRALHKYYYDRSDFKLSGDFYVGMMKAKRRSGWHHASGGKMSSAVAAVYEFASRYGESIKRPLALLIALWVLMPLVLLWIGLRFDPDPNAPVYSLSWSGNCCGGYIDALLLNISVSTIFRFPDMWKVLSAGQKFIILAETVLNGTLLGLLILSIRRVFAPKKPI